MADNELVPDVPKFDYASQLQRNEICQPWEAQGPFAVNVILVEIEDERALPLCA